MAAAGLGLYGTQALFARWWFHRFRYGPLEWLWRAATRGTWTMPMRVANAG